MNKKEESMEEISTEEKSQHALWEKDYEQWTKKEKKNLDIVKRIVYQEQELKKELKEREPLEYEKNMTENLKEKKTQLQSQLWLARLKEISPGVGKAWEDKKTEWLARDQLRRCIHPELPSDDLFRLKWLLELQADVRKVPASLEFHAQSYKRRLSFGYDQQPTKLNLLKKNIARTLPFAWHRAVGLTSVAKEVAEAMPDRTAIAAIAADSLQSSASNCSNFNYDECTTAEQGSPSFATTGILRPVSFYECCDRMDYPVSKCQSLITLIAMALRIHMAAASSRSPSPL